MNHLYAVQEEHINRNSFIFYDSFYKAMKNLTDEEKLEYIDAICCYSLYDEIIEMDNKIEGMFELIKPQIDANIKRRKDGAKGGRPSNKD
jgi:hypothetical protein